jgi:phosphoribosylformimino-5-aminoimidazole carboxamide ribonucleotide (ProFAR) isomerase
MSKLILLPAVDVSNGVAVRLTRGQVDTDTEYGDPIDVARDFVEQGAEWLHLVDLDAAFGRGNNTTEIRRVVNELAGSLNIQLSGGIRDADSLNRALEAGVRRVNLGTAALTNPDWVTSVIAEHGNRVAVGLDVRGTTLAARGTTEIGADVFETLEILESGGCSRYIVTDVDNVPSQAVVLANGGLQVGEFTAPESSGGFAALLWRIDCPTAADQDGREWS